MRLDRKIKSSKHQPRVIKNQTSIVDKNRELFYFLDNKMRWFLPERVALSSGYACNKNVFLDSTG